MNRLQTKQRKILELGIILVLMSLFGIAIETNSLARDGKLVDKQLAACATPERVGPQVESLVNAMQRISGLQPGSFPVRLMCH